MSGERDVNILVSARDAASRTFQDVGRSAEQLRGKLRQGGDESLRLLGPLSKVGALFTGAGAISGGFSLVRGILAAARGDSEAMLDTFERLPFGLGAAVREGRALAEELTGARKEAERLAKVTAAATAGEAAGRQLFRLATTPDASLAALRSKADEDLRVAGMSTDERRLDSIAVALVARQREVETALQRGIEQATEVWREGLLGAIAKSAEFKAMSPESLIALRSNLKTERQQLADLLELTPKTPVRGMPGAELRAVGLQNAIEKLDEHLARLNAVFDSVDTKFQQTKAKLEGEAAGTLESFRAAADAQLQAESRRLREEIATSRRSTPLRLAPLTEGGRAYYGFRERQLSERSMTSGEDGARRAENQEANTRMKELSRLVQSIERLLHFAPILNTPVSGQ